MNRQSAGKFLRENFNGRMEVLLTILLTELTDQPNEAVEIIGRYRAKVDQHFTALAQASAFIEEAFKD